ncbi:hypothetical protein H0H81_010811 [Sphagnurus paluster]|uniref:Mog1p/PsbP-like protein n=1 Tax=Sphagnurus paluster TaxID=117069 RepID=A0A9P7FWF2_9AGAR|nr:hypothetical protein H0H81_010811 [Sphagnurus paluster]
MDFIKRDLFGGAITAKTPSNLIDASFHFESLAHDNSAVSSEVYNVAVIPNDRGDDTPSAIILSGVQGVPKFNRTAPDEVQILMALYRVEHKNADLVVTFNIPTRTDDGGVVSEEGLAIARPQFDVLVKSLHITDFGLFQ